MKDLKLSTAILYFSIAAIILIIITSCGYGTYTPLTVRNWDTKSPLIKKWVHEHDAVKNKK